MVVVISYRTRTFQKRHVSDHLGLELLCGGVPGLGGSCLGISTDSSQTRGSVPIADRQSVHCVPVIAGSMVLVRHYQTIYQRSETRIALALEVYHSAANGDVDDSPKNKWSSRDLQVNDLKVAAAAFLRS